MSLKNVPAEYQLNNGYSHNFSLNTEQNQQDMIENLDMMSDDHTILVMSKRSEYRNSIDSSQNVSIKFIEE